MPTFTAHFNSLFIVAYDSESKQPQFPETEFTRWYL